jgi:CBS domain containing-hemolysin-like protein
VAAIEVPVSALVTVPASVTPAAVEELVAATGSSRFPVADGASLRGYVHVKDLLDAADRESPIPAGMVRALPQVGADTSLRTALRQMQTTGAHLTQVVDGTGRSTGVVMLEDALEELVGEVTDATRRA